MSPFFALLRTKASDVTGDGPTSYEVVASQTSCPQGLNTHEYMAFQSLLSGKRRRWVSILMELGSSNMNLATEAAVNLLSHLALQVGPPDANNELLGTVHGIFRDPSFGMALLQQLNQRLYTISSNWRETYLMETIVTIVACVVTRTLPYTETNYIANQAIETLCKAREFTLEWTRTLRMEMGNISEPSAAQSCQGYMLSAALLCKRTFFVYLELAGYELDESSLADLVECCITVHDNSPKTMQGVPVMLRKAITRDLRMMHEFQDDIRKAMGHYGEEALLTALYNQGLALDSMQGQNLQFNENCWIQLEANEEEVDNLSPQIIDYNYLHGALLIDGEPLGVSFISPVMELVLTQSATAHGLPVCTDA
jgi:hypothetical protein